MPGTGRGVVIPCLLLSQISVIQSKSTGGNRRRAGCMGCWCSHQEPRRIMVSSLQEDAGRCREDTPELKVEVHRQEELVTKHWGLN